MKNPYRIPNDPHVTIREILVFIVRKGEVIREDIAVEFEITPNDASVRLLKLHRWGYLKRKKSPLPPCVYHYTPSRFGRRQAKKWR